jgi:hypothetical protein
MEESQRKLLILKLYKWRGIKYGASLGFFIGLFISLINPTLAGEIYFSVPLVSASCSFLISITGYFFYPLILGSLGTSAPLDEELIEFMMSRENGFGSSGFLGSEIGGSSSNGESSGDSGD